MMLVYPNERGIACLGDPAREKVHLRPSADARHRDSSKSLVAPLHSLVVARPNSDQEMNFGETSADPNNSLTQHQKHHAMHRFLPIITNRPKKSNGFAEIWPICLILEYFGAKVNFKASRSNDYLV